MSMGGYGFVPKDIARYYGRFDYTTSQISLPEIERSFRPPNPLGKMRECRVWKDIKCHTCYCKKANSTRPISKNIHASSYYI